MKTWKKIVAFTTLTGVALGGLAYFAKKKSLEEDFNDEFEDAFDSFDEEIADDTKETADDNTDRNYVPIDLETPAKDSSQDISENKTKEKKADSTEKSE